MGYYTDSFQNSSYNTARVFEYSGKQNITDLIEMIRRQLGKTEKIDIGHWVSGWFYIEVKDSRFEHMRMGLTVDCNSDTIMWSDDTSKNRHGGNCFVRSLRWKRWLSVNFGDVKHGKVHWYSHT